MKVFEILGKVIGYILTVMFEVLISMLAVLNFYELLIYKGFESKSSSAISLGFLLIVYSYLHLGHKLRNYLSK